mgnify:CR=1 FL=1
MSLPQSDTFFLGLAAQIRWAWKDHNRDAIGKIDREYNLNRILKVLVALGYLTKYDAKMARHFRPTIFK